MNHYKINNIQSYLNWKNYLLPTHGSFYHLLYLIINSQVQHYFFVKLCKLMNIFLFMYRHKRVDICSVTYVCRQEGAQHLRVRRMHTDSSAHKCLIILQHIIQVFIGQNNN
jgi:hypothetical protein